MGSKAEELDQGPERRLRVPTKKPLSSFGTEEASDFAVTPFHPEDAYAAVIVSNGIGTVKCSLRKGYSPASIFIDVKEAKNGKKYLAITENRLGSADRKEPAMIRVYPESIEQFRPANSEAATAS